jgi:cAMP phosphodiesterase
LVEEFKKRRGKYITMIYKLKNVILRLLLTHPSLNHVGGAVIGGCAQAALSSMTINDYPRRSIRQRQLMFTAAFKK